MKLALSNPDGPVFELSPDLVDEGPRESRQSPRRRMILPIHRGPGDLVQRMLNFLQPGTYVRAHQHPRESASETIFVISGELGFVTFAPDGSGAAAHRLGPGGLVDIEAGVWHSVLALAADTVILEVKRGPFNAEDKIFAEWAPEEGSADAPGHLEQLRALCEALPAR